MNPLISNPDDAQSARGSFETLNYILSEEFVPVPIPKEIGVHPSIKRQKYIVNALNQCGYNFKLPFDKEMLHSGIKVVSFDTSSKLVLFTMKIDRFRKNKTQENFNKLISNGEQILVWIKNTETVHTLKKLK